MRKKEIEQIAIEAGYLIVEWDPLEIEDRFGYIHLRKAADKLLDRILTEHHMNTPDKELEDVRAFHQKFGFLDSGRVPTMVTKRKLRERAECIQEELDEFKLAIESQDFAEQADALIDIVYFVKGTAVMMGLPWEELWNDVQRANISKVRGTTKRGHAFDVCKPEGWQKPNGEAILEANGFRKDFFLTDGQVDETLCTDEDRRVQFKDVGLPTMIRYFVTCSGEILGND